MNALRWITPDWPAPPNVRAAAMLRTGGVSVGPYASLNLGAHVGDDPVAVAENRRRVREALSLPAEPAWLNQVHGVQVHCAGRTDARKPVDVRATDHESTPVTADAGVAFDVGHVCVVQTADCLPVLFCDRQGTRVGAAHAGWRGLAGGVLGATLGALNTDPANVLAWLGPAIEQEAFEVGAEVLEQFLARDAENATAFIENDRGRWQADIYMLARRELARLGVTEIYGGGFRCYEDRARFFSYRRENKTGRMGTFVWRTR